APPVQGVPPQGVPVPSVPQSGPPGLVTTPPPQAPPTPTPAPGGPQTQAAATPPGPAAQVTVTAPSGEVRVAGGPYMVPVFISGASRVSTITVTVSFNPAALRVRTIQEGSFLRQGGTPATFTNKVDATIGRVDLTFVRTGDTVGASGQGLLAGIMFDAVGTGSSSL